LRKKGEHMSPTLMTDEVLHGRYGSRAIVRGVEGSRKEFAVFSPTTREAKTRVQNESKTTTFDTT